MFKKKGVWPRPLPVHLFYRKTTRNQVWSEGTSKEELAEKPWSSGLGEGPVTIWPS